MVGPPGSKLIWERNKEKRKKALSGELPQEFRSLPHQLQRPIKLHAAFTRPKGLRGPALVGYLMIQDGVWKDPRFGDCINALLEHGLIDPRTHEFVDKQTPELEQFSKRVQIELLTAMHTLIKRRVSVRKASRQVAKEWGVEAKTFEAAAQQLRELYGKYRRVVELANT